MERFPDPLQVEWFGERNFLLLEPYRCVLPDRTITAPAGMKTDFASVPKFARWFASIAGDYLPAAIIHDWCYVKASEVNYPDITRKMADDMFLDNMAYLGVPWYKRNIMWAAVRAGGPIVGYRDA